MDFSPLKWDSLSVKRRRLSNELDDDDDDDDTEEEHCANLPSPSLASSPVLSQPESEELPLSQAVEIGLMTKTFEGLALEDKFAGSCDPLQQKAIETAAQGDNLFLTGKAGTGKSWVTKRLVESLESNLKTIHLVAPTGIAAINIDGITINAWAHYGIGDTYGAFDNMMASDVAEKIRTADCLLIDEISMLHGHVFDVLECMISIIREYGAAKDRVSDIRRDNAERIKALQQATSGPTTMSLSLLRHRWKSEIDGGFADIKPWGGLQIVVVGDFYQLPPVAGHDRNRKRVRKDQTPFCSSNEMQEKELHPDFLVGRGSYYAFQSYAWEKTNFCIVELTNVRRQARSDGLFSLLNDMRVGTPDLEQKHRNTIQALRNPLPLREDGIIPTELHSKNINVDQRNREELDKLAGVTCIFQAKNEVLLCPEYKQKLLKKYNLQELASMPCLWAFIELPDPSLELQSAREEKKRLDEKIQELLREGKYIEIAKIGTELEVVKEKVKHLEEKEVAGSEISLENIKQHLQRRARNRGSSNLVGSKDVVAVSESQEDSPSDTTDGVSFEQFTVNQKARDLFRKSQSFVKQVKGDHEKLSRHARQRFFDKGVRVGEKLELKKDAQVMLLWNIDVKSKLVNGSRGVIADFVSAKDYRLLLEKRLKEIGVGHLDSKKASLGDSDIPVGDAAAAPGDGGGHPQKQTNTVPLNVADDSETTTDARSSSSLERRLNMSDDLRSQLEEGFTTLHVDRLKLEYKGLQKLGFERIPVVRFVHGRVRAIVDQPFSRDFRGCGTAIRWQLPITLAWAITIHKSQGMTIDWLKVDLSGCFSSGQAYVACSRGTSVSTMEIKNFCGTEVRSSPLVKKFYENDGSDMPKWDQPSEEEIVAAKLSERYRDLRCETCGAQCEIKMCRTDKNGNYGRWYVVCGSGYARSHTFEFVSVDG